MTHPVYKIETYTGAALDYTITSDAISIYTKDIITSGVGTFQFSVPTKKNGSTYYYNDIALDDKVKIYYGYAENGGVGARPNFVGKIDKILGPLNTSDGYIRVFSGMSQGEILLRRLCKNKIWPATAAHDIADAICDDLTLGKDKVQANLFTEDIQVETERYFDVLRRVSDYWRTGLADVKNDFYVDVDNDLVWAGRPIRKGIDASGTADAGGDTTHTVDAERTEVDAYWRGCWITYTSGDNNGLSRYIMEFDAATDTLTHLAFPNTCDAGDTYTIEGVETLTVGSNILSYSVQRDNDTVKNYITVYGDQGRIGVPGLNGRTFPSDQDLWTLDAAGNWTADIGTVAPDAVTKKVGADSLKITTNNPGPGPWEYKFRRSIASDVPGFGVGAYQTLNFWIFHGATGADHAKVRLYAPDNANYFEADLGTGSAAWEWKSLQLGQNQEYDADKNPSGPWTKGGVGAAPNWSNLSEICFYWCLNAGGQSSHWYDGFYFGHGRFRGSVNDASTVHRDAEYVFNNLTSDSLCTQRANTLLYQLKDAPVQITVTVPGNTNILIGDRIPLTIPAEGITAANYDVISVEHTLNATQGFRTTATMINAGDVRRISSRTPIEAMINQTAQIRDLTRGERGIV